MKFYDCKTAPSPRRVRMFLAEKGLDIETVQVDLGTQEQFSDWYREINSDCVVPALKLDSGEVLSEVIAICSYLESVNPLTPLMGSSDLARAEVLMWNAKMEQQGLWAVADAFRNKTKGLVDRALPGQVAYPQIPELAERGLGRVGEYFHRLDEIFATREFVAGDAFSLADITAFVAVEFASWVKVPVPDDALNLRRWHEAVSERPSAAA